MSQVATCRSCGADVEPVSGRAPSRCPVCAGKRNRWIIAAALVAVVGGATALIVTQVDFSPAKRAETGSGSAGSAGVVASLPDADADVAAQPTELAAIAACDARRILHIVQAYVEDDKYVGAIRASEAYQAKCERSSLLDWKLFYAHEKLKQWKPAIAVVTRLLTEQPNDSDFWWWRGKARSYAGEHEGAVVDIRQSLADATEHSNGVQVSHLERATTALKQPCEHAFALRWLVTVGVELASSAEREFHQVYLANECEQLDGRGSFTWANANLARAKFKGTVAGKAAQFRLDRSLGTTLVAATFADALALPRGTEVDVMLPTGLGKGWLSSADIVVGAARATAIPVVIVDKLPAGDDAVLALSFLWRFDVQPTDDGHIAKAPEH